MPSADSLAVQPEFSVAPARSQRLVEFDHLRGIAIALIVIGHSIVNSGHGFPLWLENLLRGGTGVFVFISGFFFHRVFYARFDYPNFMNKKIRNVFTPFIIISVFALMIRFIGWFWLDGESLNRSLLYCWWTVRNGYVLFPHWYVPFIMLTFLCAPLHMRYIRIPAWGQIVFLVAGSLLSVFMHRPEGNINTIQSLFYFTPFYLLGMLYSQYLPWFKKHFSTLLFLSVVVVVLTIWLQTVVYPHIGNYHKAPLVYDGIDLQFIQKMGLCVILVGLCEWWVNKAGSAHLCYLAEVSFSLFFLHPLLGMIWSNIKHYLINHQGVVIGHSLSISLTLSLALFLFQCYGTVWLISKIRPFLGDKSRMIIGC